MNPNRFALAALGFTCVAAAAGGGYLASRQSVAVQPAEAATVADRDAAGRCEDGRPRNRSDRRRRQAGRSGPARAARGDERPAPPRASAPRPARRDESPSARTSALRIRLPHGRSSVPSGFPSDCGTPQPASEPSGPPPSSTTRPPKRRSRPAKAPEKEFAELVVSSNSVIGLQLDGAISSDRANLEDQGRSACRPRRARRQRGRDSRRRACARVGDGGRARRKVQGSRAPRHPVPYARAG